MQITKFYKQVDLLLRILPDVMGEECFALKGGTAINMFFRNMPRLSVDLDLCYTAIENRAMTLSNIDSAFRKRSERLKRFHKDIWIKPHLLSNNKISRLDIWEGPTLVKVEVNYVIRGSVYPWKSVDLCQKAQETFKAFSSARCLSIEDLFGSKICAALDRQHPRDLFDIKLLLENEGITKEIRQCFIIYLISHNRPMSELINPNRLDFKEIYEKEFEGMATIPISYQELIEARENLITAIQKGLTNNERLFLLSIKERNPKWDLMPIAGIKDLPSIRWKLMNIEKIDRKKHQLLIDKLKEKLEI